MYIKHIILAGITFGILGCIGENPTDTTTPAAPEQTTPTTSTPSGSKAATPGTPGVEPAIYKARTSPSGILQAYFQEYAAKNSPLDKRAQYASTNKIDSVLEKLTKWSAAAWKDQHGTTMLPPPAASNVHIVYDKGGSILAADDNHIVHNLRLDKETGLYIPAQTTVLATKIEAGSKSWIDVKGRLGSAQLDMDSKSVIDLTKGYGLVLAGGLADITYDDEIAETGILELKESGELRNTGGYFLLHKADVEGNMGVNGATFNFQTRDSVSTDNIGFFHTAGKIHPLAEEGEVPDIMMTVNGPFQFKPGAKIEMFFNNEKASRIVLAYPFSITAGQGEPVIEGAFSFIPKVESLSDTTGDGILLMESNHTFPATLTASISQLVHGNVVLGKKLSLVVSDNKKYIYLKIANAAAHQQLKASLPIQHAMETFRQGELKSELWQRPASLTRTAFHNTQLIVQHLAGTHSDTSTYGHSFGLKHVFNLDMCDMVLTQIAGRMQTHDSTYRFLPRSHDPFWIMQHKLAFEKGFALGSRTLTPSLGFNHFIIPTTLFQEGFQTIQPELSLKSGIDYITESNSLSLNMIVKGTYHAEWGKRNDQHFSLDTGINIDFQTSTLNILAGVINPISEKSQVYLSFSTNW